MTNSLCFPSAENIFIFSSFLKNIFTRYRIQSWLFFSFSTWKCCALPSGLHDFIWEIHCHSNHSSSTGNVLSLSHCFFCLAFRGVIMMCLGIDFLGFILFGFCSASWSWRFIPFAQFREFSDIISSNTFCFHMFFFSFWDSTDTNVRPYVIVPQVSEALFICSSRLFPMCCSGWVNFIALFSTSLILSSVIFNLLLS